MPVVFNRIFAYCATKNIKLLSISDRQALGTIIASAYFQSKIKKPIHRVEKKEPEGAFKVLYYPKEFRKEMDQIIKDYCEVNNLHQVMIKRKRIPIKSKPQKGSKYGKQIFRN
jgi:hypothetical protein